MSLDNADKLRALGIPIPSSKTAGQTKVRCPRCAADAKHKNKTDLSVDLDSGMFRCHNTPECDFKGYVNKVFIPEKVYTKPVPPANHTSLHPDVVKEFAKRGITQQTLIKMKIMDGPNFFYPKKEIPAGIQWAIMFPYFEKGQLVNIKYRSAFKQFTFTQGAKLIFYNIDAIADYDWCIICEGEIDALTFVEGGYDNVVSVPNGASAGSNQRLEFLDNCWEAFENKTKIILATDDDEPGRALRAELIRRFGAERCYIVQYVSGCKDINEQSMKAGILSVKDVVDVAKPCPIRGIKTGDDLSDEVIDLFQNGLPPGDRIGIRDTDTNEELMSFLPGQITIITGIPNHGKSEGTDQDIVQLSLQHGWRWGLFSPENYPTQLYVSKLIEKITGKHFGSTNSNVEKLTDSDIAKAMAFINDHFFFITEEDTDSFGVDDILEYARILVKKYGIRGLLIDPWNALEHSWDNRDNETSYINRSLKKIISFDRANGVHTFLIAHPEKMKKASNKTEYPIPTLYNISGSGNWANRADNGVCWYRNYKDGTTTRIVQKVKHKHQGKVGTVKYTYNVMNGRMTPQPNPHDLRNWMVNGFNTINTPALDFAATPDIITPSNNLDEDPF